MKAIALLLIFFSLSILYSATIISETFNSSPLPANWTKQGPSTSNWVWANTHLAGGNAGELGFNYWPTATGTYRYISPAFNTKRVHDMILTFRHYLDDYTTTNTYNLEVQISHDKTTWTTLWSVTTSSDIPATAVNVNIDFDKGMADSTYVAFCFVGNNNDIDYWMIDDISLTYTNTLGSGIWPAGEHSVIGNLIIPHTHTLQLEAGANLLLYNSQISVEGRIIANGTPSQNVVFTTPLIRDYWSGIKFDDVHPANDSSLFNYAKIEYSTDSGVDVYNTDKIRFSNCIFNSNASSFQGGGLLLNYANILVENCSFYENSCPSNGAAILSGYSSPIIRNCSFTYNSSSTADILYLYNGNPDLQNNIIANNTCASAMPAVSLHLCGGTFKGNLIANNSQRGIYVYSSTTQITNCDIINNSSYGIFSYSSLVIKNSIIWGNGTLEIYNFNPQSTLTISYSCIHEGTTGIGGNGILTSNYINNTSANPLFVSPTTGTGTGYNALNADWKLQLASPCIDTGDPVSSPDPDLSRADMGAYPRTMKPLITRAIDVAPDQGHWLYLRWKCSDNDAVYVPAAIYSIWSENLTRKENAVFINNPLTINNMNIAEGTNLCWRDGDRVWDYILSVPALNFTEYGTKVTTVQDSSSSGTHALNYMVVYQNNTGFWQSIPQSGYSVDNIPPYSPSRLDLTHNTVNQFNLSWLAVTEGTWQGNSYPETNLITYKVYSGDNPDFVISPITLVTTTTNPWAVLSNQTATKKFYKIIASDSE